MSSLYPLVTAIALACLLGCDDKPPAPGDDPSMGIRTVRNMRFVDANGDGLVEVMQIDHASHHVTAWIDDDLDGRFDRCIYEIEGVEQSSQEVDIPVPLAGVPD